MRQASLATIVVGLMAQGSASASADGFVGGGGGLVLDHFFNSYLSATGGVRLSQRADLPLWLRGGAAYGSAGDFAGGGRFLQARVGIEGRDCSARSSCLLLALDIGWQHQTWSESPHHPIERHHGPIVGTRIGKIWGVAHWQFEFALQLYGYRRTSELPMQTTHAIGLGGGVALAVLRRL